MGGWGGGGTTHKPGILESLCELCFYPRLVVKNNPPRKAVAESLGTFMPNCCFSLIFISYIYISISFCRGDMFLCDASLLRHSSHWRDKIILPHWTFDFRHCKICSLWRGRGEEGGGGKAWTVSSAILSPPKCSGCASSWTVSNASHTATTKIILH